MRTKVRVLANIYVEGHADKSLFQFNRVVPIYYYHAIRAFVKNCPLIKNATEEDFQTVILITILCSNDENAMTILHGLEGCAKNSFFDELTRKKANAVDTEAIKITLNSVYGKGAFNRDTDSVSEELRDIVRDARAMSRFIKERRMTMEDLIKVEIKLICCQLSEDELDEVDRMVSLDDLRKMDLNIDAELTEDDYNKLLPTIEILHF